MTRSDGRVVCSSPSSPFVFIEFLDVEATERPSKARKPSNNHLGFGIDRFHVVMKR